MTELRLRRQDDLIRLFFSAQAFIGAAERLCEAALEDGETSDSEDLRVVQHLAYLGVEMYLKVGLLASDVPYPKTHDLRRLRKAYFDRALALPLQMPRFLTTVLGDLHPTFPQMDPVPMAEHFERYRYACDHDGRPFPPLPAVDVRELQQDLALLQGSAVWWLTPVLYGWKEKSGGKDSMRDRGGERHDKRT